MTTTTSPTKKREFNEITNDEVKLYDRQIRLWGLEAQSRMRNARILAIGVTGLSNEVIKNIVLAGVGHVTLLDGRKVHEKDLGCQFLLRKENIGENKAKAAMSKLSLLNPRVDIAADQSDFESKPVSFFKDFDLVVMTLGTPVQLLKINEICRSHSIKFWAAKNMGFHSFIFADLIQHDYTIETKLSGSDGDVTVKTERSDKFIPLSSALARTFDFESRKSARKWKRKAHPLYFAFAILWEYYIVHKKWPNHESDMEKLEKLTKIYLDRVQVDESFLPLDLLLQVTKCREVEFSPSCAIVGGFLGQEVLKVLAKKEVPFNNIFLHDSWEATGFRMKIE